MKFEAGTHWSGRLMLMLAAAALLAVACSASTTLNETTQAVQDPAGQPESTSVPVSQVEPTAVPGAAPSATTTPPAAQTPVDGATPEAPVVSSPSGEQLDEFRGDAVLGLDSSGYHAYAGTTVPWEDQTPCDAEPTESMAVVKIDAAAAGDVVPYAAGLVQAGDVRQILPSINRGELMVLSQCGPTDAPTMWLQLAVVNNAGQIESMGRVIPLASGDDIDSGFLTRWIDEDTVELRVFVQSDPDDAETWVIERRRFNVRTGELVAVEQDRNIDEGGPGRVLLWSTVGADYHAIDDPAGSLGCEGFGVGRTIEVDNGSSRRLALGEGALTFSDVSDFHEVRGYVSWTSGCEGFVTAYVGSLSESGSINDVHAIRTFDIAGAEDADFIYYRVTTDGFLHGVGRTFSPQDSAVQQPAFFRYDLSTDPSFVSIADPPVNIDAEPLLVAIDGVSSWHVGETLAADRDRACGGRTLYGKTANGFHRTFPVDVEIDAIVDIDAAETRVYRYDEGAFRSRTVVMSTACPEAYEGVRVWHGIEGDSVQSGVWLERADMEEVRQVLSVRDQIAPGADFVEKSFVQVENFDGTVVEIELISLPPS